MQYAGQGRPGLARRRGHPGHHPFPHSGGLQHLDAVAALALGRVAGHVGRAQRAADRVLAGIEHHHADADTHQVALALMGALPVLHGHAQALRQQHALLRRGARQQHGEFITAQARHPAQRPDHAVDQPGHVAQHLVARRMAALLVDVGEVVQ
ncbi:conserved hypothetical protein, partial [Ricinus communis]